jgi:transposase
MDVRLTGVEDGAMRESMEIYPRTAAERAMKLQEVLLRATSGKIKWWQAAELIGISERQMRRWRRRYEEEGDQGLLDRRRRKASSRRVPKEQAEEVVSLHRDKYFDLNVRHFHEKLGEEHQIGLSYTWVKQALQSAGLVKRKARRGVHRKRRERRPLPGMMLHIDGSEHRWFQDERRHDLIVITFEMTNLGYEFPAYGVPDGETMDSFLRKRVEEGIRSRYLPKNDPALYAKAKKQAEHELRVIERLGLAGYSLIVWDIVH